MRREDKGEELREDLGARGGLLVGVIVAALVVVGVILFLLATRQANTRRMPPAPLAVTSDSGREERLARGSRGSRSGFLVGPLSIPDGGWPTEPRSLKLMDEIPAGLLRQGSLGEQIEEDETSAGDIEMSRFFIDRYEVTNAQYEGCVEAGVCRPADELDGDRFGAPRQPVVGVSWHDAATYCLWVGKRLPTEAEWERAARGDDRRTYPWGDQPPTCSLALFTQCDRYGPGEVGGRPDGAGPFGTQDLAGNVWEWVRDWYAPRYYPTEADGNPQGPPAGRERVLRGGSWHFGPLYIRSANRHSDDPRHRTPWYGFRCAYSPPTPANSEKAPSGETDGGTHPRVLADAAPPHLGVPTDGGVDNPPDALPNADRESEQR